MDYPKHTILSFNSARATNGRWQFQNSSVEAKKIRVKSAVVPKSFYQINSSNNSVYIEDDSVGFFTATIASGNYTYLNFASALKTALEANHPDTPTATYTVSVSEITGKITISTAYMDFRLVSGGMLSVLGFVSADSMSMSKTGDYPINLNPLQNIYLRSFSINQKNESLILDGSTNSNVLCSVPLAGDAFDYVFYQNSSVEFSSCDFSLANDTDLYFTDYSGNVVDFNGVNYSVDFEIEY